MIEIIYKDETECGKENQEVFNIPRNIRQIGLCGGKNRIYMEDYVYTFVNRITERVEDDHGRLAILMGKAEWSEGVTYIFVKGVIYLDEVIGAEHIVIENESWKTIQEIGERYFSEFDVVGWFLTLPQMLMEVTEVISKTHLKYFGGGEKILMLMDAQEKDEAFYYYENGKFIKSSGYYLYYEKNQEMQKYIEDHKWWQTSENEKVIPDEAVKNFRKKVFRRTSAEKEKKEKPSVFSYAATACLVLAVLVTGGNFLKNYQQIQKEKESLETSAIFTLDENVLENVNDSKNDENKKDSKSCEESINNETGKKETDEMISEEKAGDKEADNEEINNEETNKDESGERKISEEEETSGKSVLETYMIRPGDTLYQISILNYGNIEAMQEICRMNNISEEEKIYPGQIIVLP